MSHPLLASGLSIYQQEKMLMQLGQKDFLALE